MFLKSKKTPVIKQRIKESIKIKRIVMKMAFLSFFVTTNIELHM